jgi:hypothetical protein
MKRFFLERATNNTNRVYAWENNGNSSAVYLRTSTTGITGTFTRQAMNGITRNWRPKTSGGFPYDDDLFYLVTSTNGIFATIDGGTEWLEKTGDFNLATSAGVSVPDAGAATSMTYYPFVIVPLWVDA